MPPCTFSETTSASPAVIWKTCFELMQWQEWDVDVQELLDVPGGCENGTSFVFHMKDGFKIPVTFSDVATNESLTFSGSVLGGAVQFKGTLLLEVPQQAETTKVTYTFGVTGCLGSLLSLVESKDIVHSTQAGLESIIRLSEQASSK